MMDRLKNLEDEISAWPYVSIIHMVLEVGNSASETRKWGHMHSGGVVDIPLPRSIRDALSDQGLADEHHWVPQAGWITFRVPSEDDLKHALGLMRSSYLRYALKTASDSRRLLEQE